ncbi:MULTISPECIES: DUF742 domain-containing protein [Streptomyces]|uniref:DUF742 domain-containing protein n=2 Tax=Streptomyces TaxID=1883 RepID=A0A367FCF2_9ACTN|nr:MULTISPECIES: DUF742 domain-containing protein [Streptomyces]RCG17953.1 DUF742 domain-containing protein [Streptomyces reniochalinae]RCG28046.1 DUF742 domain-containing protein [Streptomyces diacarni]
MNPPADNRRLVPAYLATTGRARPSRNTLDRLTVLHGASDPATVSGLRPEETRLLELLRGGALSLAEAAAHLRLPVSVVKVLVADLVDAGRLMARAPIPDAELPERQILEKVLNGLRTLKSS